MNDKTKSQLIGDILEIELQMFLTVPVRQKASCQEQPDTFRIMRKVQFDTWSEKTLDSYLKDLQTAEEQGLNLMTLKYARMTDDIPRQNDDPLIEVIVSIEYAWQEGLMRKYPSLMGRARPLRSSEDTDDQTSFETYLRSELETYSHRTLTALHEDIERKQAAGENITKEVYDNIVRALGYESLEAADAAAKKQLL